MSLIDSILGIEGLVIQRVDRAKNIHIWANTQRLPACIHCQATSPRIKATYKRTLKHSRKGTQLLILKTVKRERA